MIESDSEGSGDEDNRNLVTQASKRKRCEVTAWYSFAWLGCIGLYDMKVCMDGMLLLLVLLSRALISAFLFFFCRWEWSSTSSGSDLDDFDDISKTVKKIVDSPIKRYEPVYVLCTRAGICMFMFMTSCGCLHRGQRLLITT